LLWAIAAVLLVTTVVTGQEIVWLILAGGVVVLLARGLPVRGHLAEGASALLLLQLLAYFSFAGTFVFGSGLAIVPFLHGGVVSERQWLTETQFLDAVAVALITPGPVVITTGFIGYLVAGPLGAIVAAAGTFLPCFLLTVIPAPYFHRYGNRPWLKAAVAGITAGAIGAIAGAVVVLGRQSVRDLPTAVIALCCLVVALRFRKVPEPLLIVTAGIAGVVLRA
jgi:chromate transporter